MEQNASVQFASPDWCLARIELGQEYLVNSLTRAMEKKRLLIAILYIALLSALFFLIKNQPELVGSFSGERLEVQYALRHLTGFGFLFLVPRILIRTSSKPALDIALTIFYFAGFFISLALFSQLQELSFIEYLIKIAIEMGLTVLTLIVSRRFPLSLRLLIIFIVTAVSSYLTVQQHYSWVLTPPGRLLLAVSLVVVEESRGLKLRFAEIVRFLASPTSIFFPIGASNASRALDEGAVRLYVLGSLDFIKGGLALAAVWILQNYGFSDPELPMLRVLIEGSTIYLSTYLVTMALLSFGIGAGRWFGFSLFDPMRAPLLAADPLERWKRWNIYDYNWMMDFGYRPFLARFSSQILAVGAAFIAYFLAFLPIKAMALLFDSPIYYYDFTSRSLMFVADAFLICSVLALPRLWPSGRNRSGWSGVIATFAFKAGASALVVALQKLF